MAKLRGTGIAAVNYPTGMNLGGDPSQALIHATTSGSFNVVLSSADLGQGLRTVIAQIAAETLGVDYDQIVIDTADTDTGPHYMGTFASRATHRVGNAVKVAAIEAREACPPARVRGARGRRRRSRARRRGRTSWSRVAHEAARRSRTSRRAPSSSTAARSPAAARS